MFSIYLKKKPDINEVKINNRYLYLLDELMFDLECDLARNKFNFDGFLNPEYIDLLNNVERDINNWNRCLKNIFSENVFIHSKNGKKSYTVESYTMYGQKVIMYFGLYSPLNRYELNIRIEFLEIVGSCSYLTYIPKANTNDNLYCFMKNCLMIFQYINDVILIKYNRYVIKNSYRAL